MRAVRAVVRFIVTTVLWTAAGVATGIVLATTVTYLFGYRSLTVMSGSMEPAIHTGDVVVVKEVTPQDVRIGDVVTFRDPSDASRLITHRVHSMSIAGAEVRFVTKGDSNTGVENWKVATDGRVGLVSYRLWHLGYVLFYLRSGFGRFVLVVIPALLLGVYEIWRIWRPDREETLREIPA